MSELKVRVGNFETICPKCGDGMLFQPTMNPKTEKSTEEVDKAQARCGTCGWAISLSWPEITPIVEDIGYLCLKCGKKDLTDKSMLIPRMPYASELSCKECKREEYEGWIDSSESQLKKIKEYKEELESKY